ncbi:ABC transporter ATP-binding protein [Mycoplasmopsis synoviae]|uniref:Putative ABC transporter ATP-binding protein n=2 Tax=Mycoplasmopsis synoviae TaxID=2109 RepID=Q4A5A7_MYCS5|nr:ABC transporter ATP-binding protein [Mycoplasmopsis synoviae]AAZ44064.2 putative ABC transporter ATP-binding protein [Mycoplasmopsis synoviae 53]QGL45342.1 ABC transporter ATP-binding protein [Mycoplasmopsis synoviae]QXV99452.1 ABC transporter ATP-binding protein [Mycoplasmopsis synoviae]UBM43629.1 ABC transporter ATP-binding protein [Mycoplasmopsis synoviae]UBX97598.1 ABC transporter ATP-binding protein [Mycoplasmopsis synoviae]
MQNKDIVLNVKSLTKTFKKYKALDNLSFKVYKKQLYGFLGINGAGKSTTLNIIMGLLSKDSGEIELFGENIKGDFTKIRNNIGIVFQSSILDSNLTVYENLYSRLLLYKNNFKGKKIKEVVSEIISEFKLEDLVNQKYGTLSGGQKRRVDIARALAHKPSILFLDEPTTGLDPVSKKLVWDILSQLQKEKGLTIILTTHYMQEADNCDYAIVIKKGVKLDEGTPSDLKTRLTKAKILIQAPKDDFEINYLLKKHNLAFEFKTDLYKVEFDSYQKALEFTKKNINHLKNFELIKGDMEEAFINSTKKHLEGSK